MRLIDADDAIKEIATVIFNTMDKNNMTATESSNLYETCCLVAESKVDKIKTAYDVESVVKEVQNMHLKSASEGSRVIHAIRKGGVK